MSKERIISGIDIGSSKVVTIIGQVSEENGISIIGVSSVPSKGIKKGVVVDIDAAVDAISESLVGAERMAGYTVPSVYVTVDGTHVSSVNSPGVVAVSSPDGEITQSDVSRVIEAARAISIPSSREIIHVIPRSFNVDSQEGVQDPVGMSGVRLQVETHIISGSATSMRNLVKCVQQVGLDVEDLVFGGLAAADAVLTDTERELGVVLVDIGGGTTSLVVFTEGSPVYSSVLPIGGKNITNDIAIGLRVSLEEAEAVKTYVSNLKEPARPESKQKAKNDDEDLDVSSLNIASLSSVDKKYLVEGIIKPRLEEIFELLREELKKSGFGDSLPSGLVVCGGGASTVGVEEVVKKVIRCPVRIGQPQGVSGLIEEVSTPAFAATIGTVIFASNRLPARKIPLVDKLPKIKDYWNKAVGWAKGFLP
ncbi:cell division protein FtsA [candidate division CPR3 bacterium 4484_211]|uniref:Cell division protein FtsA n=1 Tax=candidate division CPR3 bacterium 4484_211 TaxID=1968527 RepID=A0A1W9NYD2_UNCC3|nr:MAG: cell division protein FtsA [candidate division CPR3 bacterium 4484_211]